MIAAPPMPIIVGAARSGTTLLRLMLDAHSMLAIPGEIYFLFQAVRLEGTGDALRLDLYNTMVQARRWNDFHLDATCLWEELLRIQLFDLGAGVRCFYRLYAERFGKRRYGEKTPMYGTLIPELSEVLPEARFLHLIRDGRDVVVSNMEVYWGNWHTVADYATWWLDTVREIRRQGDGRGNYLELRYEDLVERPKEQLKTVCQFLELSFEAGMLHYYRAAAGRLGELEGFRDTDGRLLSRELRLSAHLHIGSPVDRSRAGRSQGVLSQEEREIVQGIAGEMLDSLGYC
jgi:hypothetical protein